MNIAIVGAGIGGLTAALACHEADLSVAVYEQSAALGAFGAGIQLGANATKVLNSLGLKAELQAVAIRPLAVHLRTWKTSYLIAQRPLGSENDERYGAPYYHLHRADLQQVLVNAVNEHAIPLHLDHRVTGIRHLQEGVQLEFATQPPVKCDVLIGADGIHSTVRHLIHGDDAPTFTGNCAWRALVPCSELPESLCRPYATVYLGPGAHLVHYLVRGGDAMNIVAVAETREWTGESWQESADPNALRSFYQDWHVSVRRLLEPVTECHRWALYDREPMRQWGRGVTTLLGDACHPMLPFLAQGAAMAIEDAWILSRMLESYEHDPVYALGEYERFRKPRTARVQLASRAQAQMFHLSDTTAVWKRNARLALGSRFVPDLAMAQYDWLYGYETVRGFSQQ